MCNAILAITVGKSALYSGRVALSNLLFNTVLAHLYILLHVLFATFGVVGRIEAGVLFWKGFLFIRHRGR